MKIEKFQFSLKLTTKNHSVAVLKKTHLFKVMLTKNCDNIVTKQIVGLGQTPVECDNNCFM